MKRLINALNWPGGYGWLVLAIAVVVAFGPACTTPTEKDDTQNEEEVIGKPPPADEDPFFVKTMPGEAVPVAPSGSIGDEEGDETDASKEPEEPASAQRQQDKPAEEQPEPQAPGAQRKSDASRQPQCFSCVRICPAEGDCDDAKEDVICGWGVHTDSAQAKRMARAECDATLNMARQMPVWSEIAGECPAATCR